MLISNSNCKQDIGQIELILDKSVDLATLGMQYYMTYTYIGYTRSCPAGQLQLGVRVRVFYAIQRFKGYERPSAHALCVGSHRYRVPRK